MSEPGARPEQSWLDVFRPPWGLSVVWLAMPILATIVRLGLGGVKPYDYWWPIVQGRAMEQLGRIPEQNLFLFTMPADAFHYNQPWLAQWSMWFGVSHFGHASLAWCAALMFAGGIVGAMLFALSRGAGARSVGVVASVAAIIASPGMSVRTQMFAPLCFVLIVYVAYQIFDRRMSWRYSLPLLALGSAVWANVHGTFILAPLLVGALGVGELVDTRRELVAWLKRWGGAVAACVVGALVNPKGLFVYYYAVMLPLQMKQGGDGLAVSEWMPLDLSSLGGIFFYAVSILALVLAGWLRLRGRLGTGPLILLLGMTVLGWGAARNLLWWGYVVLFVFAPVLPRDPPEEPVALPMSLVHLGFALALISGGVLCLPELPAFNVLTAEEHIGSRSAHLPPRYASMRMFNTETPLESMKLLEERGYPGELYHAQSVGGLVEYVMARDEPRQVAFVDQRFEMTPEAIWLDYAHIARARSGWADRLDWYGVETLLLDRFESPELDAEIERGSEWVAVHREMSFTIYMREPLPQEWTPVDASVVVGE